MKRTFKHIWTLALIIASTTVFLTSCDNDDNNIEIKKQEEYKTPKYVFFFIGDGMAMPQINVTEAALNDPDFKLPKTKSVGLGALNMRKFPVIGMQTTYAEDRYITGSAASATALATGYKTTIGTISMNGEHNVKYKTMAEMSKDKGMKVGIISSVSIDHATPACFYAHTNNRGNYQEIGQDLIKSNFDYFAGGSVQHNRYKDYTLDNFKADAKSNGYSYVNTKTDFDALSSATGKVIATLEKFDSDTRDGCALPYLIDLNIEKNENNKISLSDFTKKGIEILDNDKGFMMMVEGGKIDWACHANDVVSAAHNLIEFDKAIGHAIDFYNQHPDETLIVITGDHECGGLTLGFASTAYQTAFDLLKYQNMSFVQFQSIVKEWKSNGNMTFTQALEEVEKAFGLGNASLNPRLALSEYETEFLEGAFNRSMTGESEHKPEEISVLYGSYDPFTVSVTHILNNKAGIDWTSFNHTGVPVPVFALGQGENQFGGYYDNTDVAKKIIEIAELNK